MSTLLNRTEQAVSATAMARSFGARLEDVTSGRVPHLVILTDNQPAAVLIRIEIYQALKDELEDLRADLLAIERLPSLGDSNTVSFEDMLTRFK